MDKNNKYNIALLGAAAELLTIGLLAVRRDLRIVGIYPGPLPCPQQSPEALKDLETTSLHSTLLLGCPIFNDAAELSAQSDLLLVSSDIMSDNMPDTSGHDVIYLRHAQPTTDKDQWKSLDIAAFDTTDNADVTACQKGLYFRANSANARSRFLNLWSILQAPATSDSDAGILNWPQACQQVGTLFAAKVNA